MTTIPLAKKIKSKIHLEIAFAQDILISELYNFFPRAVIHGGTAIWRCYYGNRFSEDVDVYLASFNKKLIEEFVNKLKKNGFTADKVKFTDNALFSKFSYKEAAVRFEAIRKNVKNYSTRKFEMLDGSFIVVNTLSPEQLIKEKAAAYLNRRKIRDLYDIFFLLNIVPEKNEIKKDLRKLLDNFKAPVDEADLRAVIIVGVAPKLADILSEIKRWAG